jgi:amidase
VGVETAVVDVVREALMGLKGLGAEVIEVQMPASYQTLVTRWGVTCAVECANAHREYYPEQKALYGPALAELIDFGRNPPDGAYEELESVRRDFSTSLNELFDQVEVLILPSMPYLPPARDAILALGADPERANGLTFTAPFDYSGHPTLSVPAGLSAEKLPTSVQFVGPLLGEPVLLRVGSAFEHMMAFTERPIP